MRRRHVATFTALEALACISCFSSPTPQRRDWRCAAFCWRWFMSTQTFASRSDSRRSVTRQGVDDGGSTARRQMEIAQTLAIFGRCCLSCRGDMFFRTTDVRCLCLLKGVGCLSSVRYRLMLATSSSTIMIVYSRLTRQGVDDGGSSTARQQMEIARNLTICGGCCLSCRGEMFFRTTNVRRLCLPKGIGRLSSVRYRLLCWRPAVLIVPS